MDRLTLNILVAFLLFTTSCGNNHTNDDFYRDKMLKNLSSASLWLIEKGVYTFNLSGKEGIHRKLVDEWGVQIWVDPWIESERYIDGFWIKARGINHEIINFYREKVGSYLYEFWVVKINGEAWSGVDKDVNFYIARTEKVYGKRTIIQSSNKFIEEYQVPGEKVILFPKDDPRVLYELQAWLYPDSYENSDIASIKAELVDKGEIVLKPIEPRD